jgi:hypothetical protein
MLKRLAIQGKEETPANITIISGGDRSGVGDSLYGYDKQNLKDVKRLGYSSATLKIDMKDPLALSNKARKDMLKLPFAVFVKTVLDYQLRTHQEYLSNFLKVFRAVDKDVDGVVNAVDFKECFMQLRNASVGAIQSNGGNNSNGNYSNIQNRGKLSVSTEMSEEEMKMFLTLIKLLDPFETDRIIFSSAVTCINKISQTFSSANVKK